MGDKSPKSKQKNKDQKDAAKAQQKSVKDRRQQSYASGSDKTAKK